MGINIFRAVFNCMKIFLTLALRMLGERLWHKYKLCQCLQPSEESQRETTA